MAYDDSNQGAVFANDKGGNENRPDRKGPFTFACPSCGAKHEGEIAGWLRKAKQTGQQFLSLKWQPKEQKQQQDPQAPLGNERRSEADPDVDSEIPF